MDEELLLKSSKSVTRFGGSIPSTSADLILPYSISGNTSDFGSGVQGSSPCRVTERVL